VKLLIRSGSRRPGCFCIVCERGNRERFGDVGGAAFIDRFGMCVGMGGAALTTWKKTMKCFSPK
jgi:hypothetical protein